MPKFKVGDIIVYPNNSYQRRLEVTGIHQMLTVYLYMLEGADGHYLQACDYVDQNYRLVTWFEKLIKFCNRRAEK